MTEWRGWAVIEEGRGLVYVKQEHRLPEVAEFSARQQFQQYLAAGFKVRLTRVRIIEDSATPQSEQP